MVRGCSHTDCELQVKKIAWKWKSGRIRINPFVRLVLIAFIVLTDIRNENNRNDDADDASQDSALIENEHKREAADDEAHNQVIVLSERFQHEPGDKSDDERPYDTQNKSQNCSHDVFLSVPF